MYYPSTQSLLEIQRRIPIVGDKALIDLVNGLSVSKDMLRYRKSRGYFGKLFDKFDGSDEKRRLILDGNLIAGQEALHNWILELCDSLSISQVALTETQRSLLEVRNAVRLLKSQQSVLQALGAELETLAKQFGDRIDKLEAPMVAAAQGAKSRIETITAAIKAAELSSRIAEAKNADSAYMLQTLDDADTELAVISRKMREKLAGEKKALPDGSFPIRNVSDLRNAVQAYGRSKPGKRGLVRRHIVKRARQLEKTDLIPENWREASDSDSMVASLRERIAIVESVIATGVSTNSSEFSKKSEEILSSFAEVEITEKDLKGLTDEELDILKKEVKGKKQADAERAKYTPKTQPRDAEGKFRQVLARLKLDLGDSGADAALKKIEEVENLDNTGNYAGAAKAAGDLLGIIDRLDTGALNSESLENVRSSAGELGKVIANLPFAFGQDAQKIRFSDIPPALQQLMEDMITRVEAKIGKEDAAVATKDLNTFMSGGDYYSQSEISSQMAKLLRLLT